jgi:glucosyl-dolichyl phosphate glucuronosyltransferase
MTRKVRDELPSVTAVVCAYTLDRWDDITAGLAGIARQTHPAHEVLLVIDYNDELLARAKDRYPDVRVVPNVRTKGLSGARNTAIDLATGDVVAFLDDDSAPADDWLELLTAPYADATVLAVGGSASPIWPDGQVRPAHLPHELDWVVGCTYGGQPEELAEVRNLMGCNMSVRRAVFAQVGGFDEQAGRVGLIPLGGEETELCIRIRQQIPSARIVFDPAATVRHSVTPARTAWRYLRERSLAEGYSKAAMADLVGPQDATSVETDYVRRVLTRALRRELGRALRGDTDGWRGAAGIVTAVACTGWGYLRGRAGGSTGAARHAAEHRAAASKPERHGSPSSMEPLRAGTGGTITLAIAQPSGRGQVEVGT